MRLNHFISTKKRIKNILIEVWRKQLAILSWFFLFQKRILISFEFCNMRELFGFARMQTNLNKFKGQGEGERRASCVVLTHNGRIKKETKLDPQLNFWQVLYKNCVFSLFDYWPTSTVTFIRRALWLRVSCFLHYWVAAWPVEQVGRFSFIENVFVQSRSTSLFKTS